LNVAKQGAEGYDTELTWSYDASFGQLNADLLWSHMLHRTKTPYDGAEEQDLAGRYTDPTQQDGGAYPKDKANFSLGWAYNDFTVNYQVEYIGSLNADTFCNCGTGNRPDGTYIQSISSQMYHDIAATYTLNLMGTNTTIAAGITNIGDKAPPYIEEGFNATTAPTVYRLFGRGYYLRLRWKF
jgi:outer membrane receptor for ferrienterochelin and colicin